MNGLVLDYFAGGGGVSTGIELALGRSPDYAINHDPEAIAMHRANHPRTHHVCGDVWDFHPKKLCAGRRVALAWFSPDCFPAGALVLTDRGYRPIEELEVGDQVLTHEGRYRAIKETMSAVRPIVTVRGQGHPGLSVSPEHPFYVRAAHNVWNNERRVYERTLRPAVWVKAADLRTIGAPTNAAGGDLSFWATPTTFPELPVPDVGGRGMRADERLMWLAGRYIGDGWTRLTDTRAELVITCGRREANALRETLSVWTRSGSRAGHDELAWTERETRTAHQFATNHRGLVTWLRQHFGHRAETKSLPAWALGMAPNLRHALLDGYVSADGHTRTISGGDVTMCSTVSKALAFSIRSLVESLGLTGNVVGPYENSNEIEGRHVNARPHWMMRWRHVAQREQNVRDGIHNWTRVRSVEDEDRTAVVFNIAVEEDESYVVEGVVVHNCTYHSKARGGKPFRDPKEARGRRGLASVAVRCAREVRPDVLILENVEEWLEWGPLGADGRPCPDRRGQSFRNWLGKLKAQGYEVEWRMLRACDYGAPTIRRRLFVIARCDGLPILWPTPTHGPRRPLLPYRTAAECIDWSLPCPSIFDRKKPLAEKTLRRIARGIWRFVIDAAEPFIVPVSHGGDDRVHSIQDPLRTVTAAHRGEHSLVTPFIAPATHGDSGSGPDARVHAVEEPLRTIVTRGAPFHVVAPVLARSDMHQSNAGCVYPPGDPLRTVTTGGGHALVAPTLIQTGYGEREGQAPRSLDLHAPLGTVVADGQKHGLVSAFLAKHYGGGDTKATGSAMGAPVGTLTTQDHHAVVAAHMVKLFGSCADGQRIDAPAPTVRAGGTHLAEVRAFLQRYNGGAVGQSAQLPLGAVTSARRFGVVMVAGSEYEIVDIGMRMLQPRELFAAQGFPSTYTIDLDVDGKPLSKTAQIRMCGNSVPPQLVAALVGANVPRDRAVAA